MKNAGRENRKNGFPFRHGCPGARSLPVFPRAACSALCALMCIALLIPSGSAMQESTPVLRALLIGCDIFPERPSTAPAAESNVDLLSRALSHDARGYAVIRRECNSIASGDALRLAVDQAFSGTAEKDFSLIYISTHGVYSTREPLDTCALAFSDGTQEALISAPELKEILDGIPGVKILILDACNAGAFIGKGLMEMHPDRAVFTDPLYKVLCSAGGSEESWYWHSADDSDPNVLYGAGYFTTILADVFCFSGCSPADADRDGNVTLLETCRYLRDNYAASTPQCYPEEDGFVLLRYEKNASCLRPGKIVCDLSFDSPILTGDQDQLVFSFTQLEPGDVYYQMIYHRNGRWDWENAQMLSDRLIGEDSGVPGKKMRTLRLRAQEEAPWGYVMMLMITKPQNHPELQCSTLISLESPETDSRFKVFTLSEFPRNGGSEMTVLVRHRMPCALSVAVRDQDGNVVRRISSMTQSRPISFQGSLFYWDGCGADGQSSPDGMYFISVTSYHGGIRETAQSSWFLLTHQESEATPVPEI